MGLAYTNPKVVAASAQVTGDVTHPYNMHSVWQVQRLSDGALLQTYIDTPLTSTTALVQADWDAIYALVQTYFNAATGGTTAAANPVSL